MGVSRRVFRIREEDGEPRIRISHRWLVVRPEPPKTKPSDQELLFRLLDLRIGVKWVARPIWSYSRSMLREPLGGG